MGISYKKTHMGGVIALLTLLTCLLIGLAQSDRGRLVSHRWEMISTSQRIAADGGDSLSRHPIQIGDASGSDIVSRHP